MQLLDLSQVVLARLLYDLGNHTNTIIGTDVLRPMVLNTIRHLNHKFRDDYGQLVIACDDKNFWRKDIFPYYKAHRKADRELSELDWNEIFKALNHIKTELRDYFPYPVVQVDRMEADDIIATLVFDSMDDKNLIISGDKDFLQLQVPYNDHIAQFDPIKSRWLKVDDGQRFLMELIMKGDRGDGIPNIFSSGDTFVTKKRQKPLGPKMLENLLTFYDETGNLEEAEYKLASYFSWQWAHNKFPMDYTVYYDRNKVLIDLGEIPVEYRLAISAKYQEEVEQTKHGRSQLFDFFMDKNLTQFLPAIGEF